MNLFLRERLAKGLTIKSIARLLNVSKNAVYEWQSGGSIPKAKYVPALMELGFSMDAILHKYESEEKK